MELDDIRQLIVGNDNLNLKQIFFDASHPVDSTYVQYPQQKSPEDVFNKDGVTSTWQVINYSGAFFRAEGGNAATFIKETDSLIKQSEGTKVNGLSLSKSGGAYKTGSCYGNSQTISLSGGNHSHSSPAWKWGNHGGDGTTYVRTTASQEGGNWVTGDSGNLSMSGTMTPSITDNIGVTDNISYSISGDSETRPSNFTVRIWKRIS